MAVSKDFAFKGNKDLQFLGDYLDNYLREKFGSMFPVGHIIINVSTDKNPHDMGYPGTWQKIGEGRTLVSSGPHAPWNSTVGNPGGHESANHTHIIYAGEALPAAYPLTDAERQMFADMLPANSPNVDQAASKAATQAAGYGDSPVERFIFHSDTSHAEYEYAEYSDPSQAPASYVDYEYGTLELRPTWPVTKLFDGTTYTMSQNRITAEKSGSKGTGIGGDDLESNMPPYILSHIWKRVT